jgi:hypothetical protein
MNKLKPLATSIAGIAFSEILGYSNDLLEK